MQSKYPYGRWVELPDDRSLLGVLGSLNSRIRSSLFNGWMYIRLNHFGARKRARDKFEPMLPFNQESGRPDLNSAPESAYCCRTKHGPAVAKWSISKTTGYCYITMVENALTDIGERIVTHEPRRPCNEAEDRWTWGRYELTLGDIRLVDDPSKRPTYDPEADAEATDLEKRLAKSARFKAALVSADFANVAFLMLSQLDWFNEQNREELSFAGSGSIAGLVAGVRDRGEIYSDYKHCSTTKGISHIEIEHHNAEMIRIMKEVGWRTHTPEELRLLARADFDERVATRVANWEKLSELELRPAAAYPPTNRNFAVLPMPLYKGDEQWASLLSVEIQRMISEDYSKRVRHLIHTSRITLDEYKELTGLSW